MATEETAEQVAEREAVVKWLRDPALYREACRSGPLISESAFRWLADLIEKGAHKATHSCSTGS